MRACREERLKEIAGLAFACAPEASGEPRRKDSMRRFSCWNPHTHLDAGVSTQVHVAECALKALILENPEGQTQSRLRGDHFRKKAHDFDFLIWILVQKGCPLPAEIRESLTALGEEWSTDLRYVGALISFREADRFIKRVQSVYLWVEGVSDDDAQREALWENRRTAETRKIEELLGKEFERVEAYRFNSASIRIRVIDQRFEGKPIADREDMVLPLIRKLPKKTQDDILLLLTLTPSETQRAKSTRPGEPGVRAASTFWTLIIGATSDVGIGIDLESVGVEGAEAFQHADDLERHRAVRRPSAAYRLPAPHDPLLVAGTRRDRRICRDLEDEGGPARGR